MQDANPPTIAADELIRLIEADLEIYYEREALRDEAPTDSRTTDGYAIAALKRLERFAGEHQVAHSWLLNSPTARVWSRNGE